MMIIVYITCKDRKEAERISGSLLEKRIIACSNVFPIQSVYKWRGKVQKGKEYVMIAKTQERRFKDLKKEVERIHSYDVPCIIRMEANANKEFEQWVRSETK